MGVVYRGFLICLLRCGSFWVLCYCVLLVCFVALRLVFVICMFACCVCVGMGCLQCVLLIVLDTAWLQWCEFLFAIVCLIVVF